VPGAFEIPVMVRLILDRDPPACVIALGLIIRGSTEHADLGRQFGDVTLQQLAIKSLKPIIHEVLLVADEKQAYARCIGAQSQPGQEAARAAAAMIDIFRNSTRSMPRNSSTKSTAMPSRRHIREAVVPVSLLCGSGRWRDPAALRGPFWEFRDGIRTAAASSWRSSAPSTISPSAAKAAWSNSSSARPWPARCFRHGRRRKS
jgi:hypothetical protein